MSKNQEIRIKFIEYIKATKLPRTAISYQGSLGTLFKWLDVSRKNITDLRQEDVGKFIKFVKEEKSVKNSTAAYYAIVLKILWRWMYQNQYVRNNEEFIDIPQKSDQEHFATITPEEHKRMMDSLDTFFPDQLRAAAILSFLNDTGLRVGELKSLNVKQVYNQEKTLIKTTKRFDSYREIYWNGPTAKLLNQWIEARNKILNLKSLETDALWVVLRFDSNFGKRLTERSLERTVRDTRIKAGIERNITVHSYRYGIGRWGVKNNIHPRVIQKILGHASINTTMSYMSVEDNYIERVYRAAEAH
jgi:site-specific recombinase XerD